MRSAAYFSAFLALASCTDEPGADSNAPASAVSNAPSSPSPAPAAVSAAPAPSAEPLVTTLAGFPTCPPASKLHQYPLKWIAGDRFLVDPREPKVRDSGDINFGTDELQPGLTACLKRSLRAAAKVYVRIYIMPSGGLCGVQLSTTTVLPPPSLACFTRTLRRARFSVAGTLDGQILVVAFRPDQH